MRPDTGQQLLKTPIQTRRRSPPHVPSVALNSASGPGEGGEREGEDKEGIVTGMSGREGVSATWK